MTETRMTETRILTSLPPGGDRLESWVGLHEISVEPPNERSWSRTQESNSTPPLDAICKRFIDYTGACGCNSLCGLSVLG